MNAVWGYTFWSCAGAEMVITVHGKGRGGVADVKDFIVAYPTYSPSNCSVHVEWAKARTDGTRNVKIKVGGLYNAADRVTFALLGLN